MITAQQSFRHAGDSETLIETSEPQTLLVLGRVAVYHACSPYLCTVAYFCCDVCHVHMIAACFDEKWNRQISDLSASQESVQSPKHPCSSCSNFVSFVPDYGPHGGPWRGGIRRTTMTVS